MPAATHIADEELQLHPFFADLAPELLASAKAGCRVVALAPGAPLFAMGDRAERFWLVRRGRIKLFRIAPNGAEKVVEVVGPGQTFAEAVMFMTVRDYPVSAEALTDSEVLGFDAERFLTLLHGSPDTCLRLLGALSMRLRRRMDEIEALSVQNATLRVVTWLLQNLPREGAAVVHLEVPKKVLASQLSLQPETLSRVLHSLGEQQVIEVDGAALRVLDPARLRALTLG
jgi:CRP-like cAMP-binding protein